jgi:hypothetical protein
MASETLIRTALQLAKQLGANTSKFMGTKSNVSFLGSGPKDGMLFQQSINPESFATLGIKKVLPDLETSMSYLTGGKLNDIQANKLIDNMSVMLDVIDPLAAKNVVDASSKFRGGLESLEGLGLKNLDNVRAKSGLGERQATEAASDVKSIDDASPLMSKLENRIGGMRDETEAATGIMATVEKGDLPGKTAASREFLVNSLKVGDDYPSTTLSDVMSAQDMKYIMEGGGGAMGDPLVLVQKYFGPRIAEMIPNGGTTEEIAIFTKRVMDNVEDARGLKPDEPGFDNMTAKFVDNLADGGRAGYKDGYSVQDDMGDYGANVGKTAAPGGGFEGDGGNNNNSPVVTSGGGGITDVVPASKRTQYGFNFKNMFPGGKPFYGPIGGEEEEENKVSKMTTAANTITNYEDYNTRNQKAADIAAAFAKKEKLYAKGGRAGYAKGGLAKILEL